MKTLIIIILSVITAIAGKVEDNINDYKTTISNNINNEQSIKALLSLNQLFQKENLFSDALTYYSTLQSTYKGKEIEAVSRRLSVSYLLRDRKFDDVVTECLYVKDNFSGTIWAEEALYSLGEAYLNGYEDKKTESDAAFQEIIDDYPNSDFVTSARIYLGIN